MRLASLMLAAALSFPVVAAPNVNTLIAEGTTIVAMEVPGTQFRKPDPTFPESNRSDPTWDDTADTSDDLRLDVEIDTDAQSERDLNNDVHDPLLESPITDPVESDLPDDPVREEPHDPMSEPLP